MSRRFDWKILKTLLRSAYHEEEDIPISDHWRQQTMNRIRGLAPDRVRQGFAALFEPFVWRLVPITLAMILALSIALSNFDLVSDAEVFRLFSYELEDAYAFLDAD